MLAGLNYETCLVYLDDIIVSSKDLPTHLERLRKLFNVLRQANMKLSQPNNYAVQFVSCYRLNIDIDPVTRVGPTGQDPDKNNWTVRV